MASSTPDLVQDLLDFIALPDASDADDAAFNALALRLFAHQVRHNPAYARFWSVARPHPGDGAPLAEDIPAVPVNGFKQLTLSCTPVEACARVFTTSGTTGGEDQKGRHYHPELRVYDASMPEPFRRLRWPAAYPPWPSCSRTRRRCRTRRWRITSSCAGTISA